jgi:hypothetical protein
VTSKHRYEGKENENKNAKLGNPGHHGETKARGGLLRKVEQVGIPHMDSLVRLPVKRLICVERLILLVDYGSLELLVVVSQTIATTRVAKV